MLQTKSQSRTARILRITPDQVHHVMEKAVEFGLKHRRNRNHNNLCIDEKSLHGREFVSVLYDGDDNIVLDVVKGRTEKSVESLLRNNLSYSQMGNVLTFSMDMWEPFMKVVRKLMPYANICHDLYHCISYLNKGIDQTRRREVKKHNELRRTRYIFLKNKASWTDLQYIKFESIVKTDLEVAKAWRIKEDFRGIMHTRDRAEAWNLFQIWCNHAKQFNIPEMTKVVEMFQRHEKGIVNAFVLGRNNSRAERMNGSIQELKTIGRGYKDVEHFRIAILFFHGGLALHKDYLVNSH